MPRELVIVVPANGRGQRFRDRGVTTPKPLISFRHLYPCKRGEDPLLRGCSAPPIQTMVQNALRGAPRGRVIVGVPVEQLSQWFLAVPRDWTLHAQLPTRGQAETIHLLLRDVSSDAEVLIVNSDQGFAPDFLTTLVQRGRHSVGLEYDAHVLTMQSQNPAFSYVATHPEFRDAAEKRQLYCDYAMVGAYFFPRARSLKLALIEALQDRPGYGNEWYLSQAFMHLPQKCRSWAISPTALFSWGTPEQLMADPYVADLDLGVLTALVTSEREDNIVRSDS